MTDPDVFKSMSEWNDAGRVVKKGAKAYDSNFFTIEQTVPFNLFYISKRNGKFRRIFSLYREQKSQLRELIPHLEKVLLQHDVHKVNYAFIRNRNCVENAMQHIGYKYVVSMDLENFFESVNRDHVSKYLNEEIMDQCFISGAPQQGLPTSPLIANLAFLDCDKTILDTLKKYNISSVYTRYADDLVVSFDNKRDIGKVIFILSNIANKAGFKINKKKTKIQNINNGRIVITGVGIDNKGVHPTRKTLKKIRAAKHQNNKEFLLGITEWAKCNLPKIQPYKKNEKDLDYIANIAPKKKYIVVPKKNKEESDSKDDIPFLGEESDSKDDIPFLGKVNKTVILIDTDYLNQKIKENIEFYRDLYPDKELNTLNLYKLIYNFIVNARVESDERNIDVLFAYRLSDSLLYSTNPGNVWNFINAENLNIEEFNVTIRSFSADESADESCSKHFTTMFKMLHRSNSVDRVIMVADSEDLNNAFKFSPELLEKKLFLFRDDHDTNIDFPINFVNIAYMIAQSLGLDRVEW